MTDSFELWDLRVEVVAPEGGAIYCGAKVGDYFELRGEMIHMPPGQGFFHLFAGGASASFASQTTRQRTPTTG